MYVFLKPKYKSNADTFTMDEHFEWRDQFDLPANCRITVLNIENINCTTDDNCCKNLKVYNDATESEAKILNGKDASETNGMHLTDNENKMHTINGFYECKISIKGFKDRSINGKSIWTQ